MKNLNKFGYTKVELIIVIILVGIVAFIMINKTSYAFQIDNEISVSEVKNIIEEQAEAYAINNKKLFDEADTTYITVNDLVENGYMFGNNEGIVVNPETKESYNDNKIKLEYDKKKEKVVATLIA